MPLPRSRRLEVVLQTDLDLPNRLAQCFQVLNSTVAVKTEVLILAVVDGCRHYRSFVLILRALDTSPVVIQQISKVLNIKEQPEGVVLGESRQFLLNSQVDDGGPGGIVAIASSN